MVKKHQILSLLCLAATAALTGCHDDLIGGNQGKSGTILPSLTVNSNVEGAPKTKAPGYSRMEYSEVTPSDLALKITSADGSLSKTWDKIADFDVTEQFRVGEYLVEATYGDVETEGFGCPAYYGSADIVVKEDQETPVTLTASLANSMLTVKYTDTFTKYMTDWDATAHAAGGDYVYYAKDEARPAYLRPGATSVDVRFVKPNGQEATIEVANFTSVARHHYTITVDMEKGSGDAVLIIKYDDSLDIEDVTIDISDEVMNAPAPVINGSGVTNGQLFWNVDGMAFDDVLKLNAIAKGGLKAVTLTTQSASLEAQGWPAEVELMSADASTRSTLTALGFKAVGLWTNPDKMAQLDFTDVVNHIALMQANNTTSFQIVVKDKYGKVSEPFAFAVTCEKLELSLEKINNIAYAGTTADITLNYNGIDPAKEVTVQIQNDRGTWDNATFSVVANPGAPASRTAKAYTLRVNIPEAYADVTFRATAVNGKFISEPVIVPVAAGMSLSVEDKDVWATKAALAINTNKPSEVGNATYYISNDGTNYSAVNATVEGLSAAMADLTPGTKYWAKASLTGNIDDACTPVEFTTEAAAQLPDAGFETWNSTKLGDYQYLWTVGSGSPWATVNAQTTSTKGSGSGSGLSTGGCAYKATSGTIPANGRSTVSNSYGGTFGTTKKADGHTTGNASLAQNGYSGNAALIRTVGWGSGNSAGSGTGNPASGFATCQNVTAGQLFLGSYDDGAVYSGYTFGSRPASISFWYKYTSYGSSGDFGDCEVVVLDAAGNAIARTSCTFSAQASYVQQTLPLSYAAGCAKAAKIMVRFKSSANTGLTNSSTWLYGPGNKNVSGGEYVGSELYIDEIQLNY